MFFECSFIHVSVAYTANKSHDEDAWISALSRNEYLIQMSIMFSEVNANRTHMRRDNRVTEIDGERQRERETVGRTEKKREFHIVWSLLVDSSRVIRADWCDVFAYRRYKLTVSSAFWILSIHRSKLTFWFPFKPCPSMSNTYITQNV